MSASEKLTALDLGPGTIDDAELGTMGYDGLLALRDARPEIAAIVTAAEELPEFFHTPDGRTHSFGPLLDALVEALP